MSAAPAPTSTDVRYSSHVEGHRNPAMNTLTKDNEERMQEVFRYFLKKKRLPNLRLKNISF